MAAIYTETPQIIQYSARNIAPTLTLNLVLLRHLCIGLLGLALGVTESRAEVRVTSASDDALRLSVSVPTSAASLHDPGRPVGRTPGGLRLPYVACLVAAPPGARLSVDMQVADAVALHVDPAAADTTDPALSPGQFVETEYIGILRGVPAHAVRVYPWQLDGTGLAVVHPRIDIDVRFIGASAARPVPDGAGGALHAAFINPPLHSGWTSSRPAVKRAATTYDPSREWLKLHLTTDGVYVVTYAQLLEAGVAVDDIDPRTFSLMVSGQAHPVLVSGEQDGRFDDGDELLFVGRYRRARSPQGRERDHESEFGPQQTYWLTWGGEPGSRFSRRDVAPTREYALRSYYETTAHFEEDKAFDVLEDAPDSLADRWFWQRPGRWVQTVDPDVPGSGVFTGDLTGLYEEEPYQANVTVALQGQLGAAHGQHHTIVSLNGEQLADDYWAGQTSHIIEASVPSTTLRGRNRILLQALADRIRIDRLWFNWFRIDYRRRFEAFPGYIDAPTPASDGHRIVIEGFSDDDILLFDTANGAQLTGGAVSAQDTLFTLTFDDAPTDPARYVAADRTRLLSPRIVVDLPSDWRSAAHGADMVILTPRLYQQAAERLAAHRRGSGMSVSVVAMEDVFDEFSFGRFDRSAVADFVEHIYHQWQPRPAYLLLLGDETWDYRGKYTGRRDQQLIPTTYYLARNRGYSPSDYRLALVDGDDMLADLSIGRLAVDDVGEADAVVDKIIAYDVDPEPGPWRSRSLLAANWHAKDEFSAPLDSVTQRYTDPLGLEAIRLYADDEEPLPNPLGRRFIEAYNEGALIANFSGHGAAGTMQFLFSTQFPDWDYLSQISNGRRLPLMLALSCLNGKFVDPHTEGISELFTELPDGGAIAYVSATAISFTAQNELLQEGIYSQLFAEGQTRFGPVLDVAKARMLAAHSSFVDGALTMQLTGDPAQHLALPPDPDYAVVDILPDVEPVVPGDRRLQIVLRNNTRLGRVGPTVTVVGHRPSGRGDTLLVQPLAPFAGDDTLLVDWSLTDVGRHRVDVLLDAAQDSRLSDNQLVRDLMVDAAASATPFLPTEGAVLDTPTLQALTPVPANPTANGQVVEFELSADPDFGDTTTTMSASTTAVDGMATWRPQAAEGLWFWRVRATQGGSNSAWSPARSLSIGVPGASTVQWQQTATALALNETQDLQLHTDGLHAAVEPRLFQMSETTREDGFTELRLPGAGVLATDGDYLYAKRWFNDASTIYAGIDRFTRIGTGNGGTIRGGYYGVLSDSTTAGISATYHSDGYLYSESGHLFQIERVDPASGRLDTVDVPDGLLDWATGQVVADVDKAPGQTLHAMITSNGQQIFNVSMSSHLGIRVGWGVRVFDVDADGWRLVREFVVPPTETGFTFLWTDGVVADLDHLYLIEFGGQRRIRAVSLEDGSFVDEWTSDQEITRVISGQYDWKHDRVWLGDLHGSGMFRYRRRDAAEFGQLLGPVVGPATSWHQAEIDGVGASLQVRVPGQDSLLAVGSTLDLQTIDAQQVPFLQLVALVDTAGGVVESWRIDYAPAADLEIAGVAVDGDRLLAAIRNRGLGSAPATPIQLQTRSGRRLSEYVVAPLDPGQVQRLDIKLPSTSDPMRLQLLPASADGDETNDRADVPLTLRGERRLTFSTWPQRQSLRTGDALAPTQAVLIEGDGDGSLEVRVDGRIVDADTTWAAAAGPRAVLRLQPGQRHVEASLRSIGGARATIRLHIANRLALGAALVTPNPVPSDGAYFTSQLSQPARVGVEIYSVSGRRIRQLEPVDCDTGFCSVSWDGRGSDGRLAAGTYLFVLRAHAGEHESVRRGAFVVAP